MVDVDVAEPHPQSEEDPRRPHIPLLLDPLSGKVVPKVSHPSSLVRPRKVTPLLFRPLLRPEASTVADAVAVALAFRFQRSFRREMEMGLEL